MDSGETTPYIYEWLKKKNQSFKGNYDPLLSPPTGPSYRSSYCDFSYNTKPTLWVLDNAPRTITNCLHSKHQFIKTMSIDDLPMLMEDIKGIYVADDENAWQRYLSPINPESDMITIFVYTHKMFTKCPKDMRRTHFEGYSPLVQFYSPEYGDLPANEDFRRTLYWNPNVVSDKDGNVNLTICNTGTCKQLIVSAEAITPQGKAIKNK